MGKKATCKKNETLPDKAIKLLSSSKVYSKYDEMAMEILRAHHAMFVKANDAITEDGLYQIAENGAQNRHVAYDVLQQSSRVVLAILKEYGLTAKARLYLPQLAPEKKQSKLDEFFGKEKESAYVETFAKNDR